MCTMARSRRQRHRAVLDVHLAPVDAREQVRQIAGDHIDHLLLQRGRCRQAGRSPHRLLGPLGVAAAQFGKTADVSHRIVDDLALHGAARQVRRRARSGRIALVTLVGTRLGARAGRRLAARGKRQRR
jgi:hypothetical protein